MRDLKDGFDMNHVRKEFVQSPECIVTHQAQFRSDERSVVMHFEDEDDKPTLPFRAMTKAQHYVADHGGIVEVWIRVDCYKATHEEWN